MVNHLETVREAREFVDNQGIEFAVAEVEQELVRRVKNLAKKFAEYSAADEEMFNFIIAVFDRVKIETTEKEEK